MTIKEKQLKLEQVVFGTNKPYHSLFHAFCVRPGLTFDSQRSDEQVILVLRAHPITQLPWLVNGLFLAIFALGLNYAYPLFLRRPQVIFINVFLFAFIFAYMWSNYLKWFFNVGIITNQRIIDEDFHSVNYRETTEATLDRVQDVTEKSGGFLETFIDFGDVFIQTAGTYANIEFLDIPNPSVVVKLINNLANARNNG